ncbi:hypothetical protein EKD04_021545 [Chloroflexales bacterium ZM16-3]|nr:hypothetical protein [Chloroflexales bacterium ZM16-3]
MMLPILLLGLLLTSCSTQASQQPPAEVHTAWIAALRANDRAAAQQLLADDAAVTVDRALEQAQYLEILDVPQTGRLQAVDVAPPVVQGAGQVATSIWRLEQLTSCFRATLAETPQGWKITDWAEFQTDCPPALGVRP